MAKTTTATSATAAATALAAAAATAATTSMTAAQQTTITMVMTAASPTQCDDPEKYGYNGIDVDDDNRTTVAPATTGTPGTTTVPTNMA